MNKNEKWLEWAVELQSIAQAGLYYCKDEFDKERYEKDPVDCGGNGLL